MVEKEEAIEPQIEKKCRRLVIDKEVVRFSFVSGKWELIAAEAGAGWEMDSARYIGVGSVVLLGVEEQLAHEESWKCRKFFAHYSEKQQNPLPLLNCNRK